MTDLSVALTELVKYVVPVATGWLAKMRRDTNRLFARVRRLEVALEALQKAAATSGTPQPPRIDHRASQDPRDPV